MATLDSSQWDEFALSMSDLANMPASVLEDMILAEAEVIKEAQSTEAENMLQGPYYAGGVAKAVHINRPRRSGSGVSVTLTFKGSQHGNAIGEIAYINEYGKHGQPARPFINTANEKKADTAVEAAAAVFDKYLAEHGL